MVQLPGNRSLKMPAAGLVLLLGLGSVGWWSALGAESIRFSTSTGKVGLPGTTDTNQALEKLYDPIEKKYGAGDLQESLPMPPSPSFGPVNSRRLQDLIEQRRNWMFVTPDMALENMSDHLGRKKMGDINSLDHDSNPLTAKPKTTVERYWARQDNTPNNAPRGRKDEADENKEPYSSLQPASSVGTTGPWRRTDNKTDLPSANRYLEAGSGRGTPLSVSGIWGNTAGTADLLTGKGLDSLINPRTSDEAFFLQQQQSRQEIRQWLRPDQTDLPVSGPNDPINFFPDLTRREMQPVTAKTADEYANEKKLNPNAPGAGATSLNLRPSLLDDYMERSGTQSSLTPALATPASSIYVQPQPSTLEIPKRKF